MFTSIINWYLKIAQGKVKIKGMMAPDLPGNFRSW
jgi:hypothetical protein